MSIISAKFLAQLTNYQPLFVLSLVVKQEALKEFLLLEEPLLSATNIYWRR